MNTLRSEAYRGLRPRGKVSLTRAADSLEELRTGAWSSGEGSRIAIRCKIISHRDEKDSIGNTANNTVMTLCGGRR